MSLNVYLTNPSATPINCPHCGGVVGQIPSGEVFSANITHNLNAMASEAGIYMYLWQPDEIGVTKAAQLIEPLRAGLNRMMADPPRFEKHNAANEWGLYEDFVPWIEKYLAACEADPDADVRVSR